MSTATVADRGRRTSKDALQPEVAEIARPLSPELHDRRLGDRRNQVGLVAFLATATMLFTAFTAAYVIRKTSADWRPVPMPSVLWLTTGILAVSSITVEVARRGGRRPWLLATGLLGVAFTTGQVLAFRQLIGAGVFLASSPHASFLYVLVSVHGLHLLGGLGALIYTFGRPRTLGLFASYWHFLGAVWLYVFTLLHLS